MKNSIKFVLLAMAMAAKVIADPMVEITNVQQRYPWDGTVDIDIAVKGLSDEQAVDCSLIIPLKTVSKMVDMTNGTYRVQWKSISDLGSGFIASNVTLGVNVTPKKNHTSVQLWEGGPYWAICNIGADKPEDFGCYFWWGDTIGYEWLYSSWIASDGSVNGFAFETPVDTYGKKLSVLYTAGYTTTSSSDAVLNSVHDAATVHWGNGWRMPTSTELTALKDNCTSEEIVRNGVCGQLFTGKGRYSDRLIFIPASGYGDGPFHLGRDMYGYIWSSSPNTSDPSSAQFLFCGGGVDVCDNYGRYNGLPVRAVRDTAP